MWDVKTLGRAHGKSWFQLSPVAGSPVTTWMYCTIVGFPHHGLSSKGAGPLAVSPHLVPRGGHSVTVRGGRVRGGCGEREPRSTSPARDTVSPALRGSIILGPPPPPQAHPSVSLFPPDASVKVTLKHQAQKLKKKQTKRAKHTINPVWNEMVMFELPDELLQASSVELEVLGQDDEGQSCTLGRCSLGLHASGSERSHWEEMLKNPRRQIAMWHQLHP